MYRVTNITILVLLSVNFQGLATPIDKKIKRKTISPEVQIGLGDTIYLDPYLNHKICLIKQVGGEYQIVNAASGKILVNFVDDPIAWSWVEPDNNGWIIDSLEVQPDTKIKYGFNPKYLTFKQKNKHVLYKIEEDTSVFVSKYPITLKSTGNQQNTVGRKHLPVDNPSWDKDFISIYLELPFWKKAIDTLYTYNYNSGYYVISEINLKRNNKLKKGTNYWDEKYQKGKYKKNKKNGVWNTYSKKDKALIAYHTYDEGVLDGPFKEWAEWNYDIVIEESAVFREGSYHSRDTSFTGDWICYPQNLEINGKNISKLAVKENDSSYSFEVFVDDDILIFRGSCKHLMKKERPVNYQVTDYYLPGEIDNIYIPDGPALNGKLEIYDTLGNLKALKHYGWRELHGVSKTFDKKGRPTHETQYSYGLKNGLELEYNYSINGKAIDSAFYSNDTLDGKYVSHYINGLLSERGVYKNGTRDSIWQFYSPFGGIYKEINYSERRANDYEFRLFLPPNKQDLSDHIVSPNGKYLFTRSNNLSLYDIGRKKWLSQNLTTGDLRYKVLDESKRGHGLTFFTLNNISNDGSKAYDNTTELDLRTGKKADTLSNEAVYLSDNPNYFNHLKEKHQLGETNEHEVDFSKDTVTIWTNSYCLLENDLWIWETISRNIKLDGSNEHLLLIRKLKKYNLSDSTTSDFPDTKLKLVDTDCEYIVAESFGNNNCLNLVIFNTCRYSEAKIYSFEKGAKEFKEHETFSKSVNYNNLAMLNDDEYLYRLDVYDFDTDSLIKPFFNHFTKNISSVFLSGKDSLVLLKNNSLDNAIVIDLSKNSATTITKAELIALDYFDDFQLTKENDQISYWDVYGHGGYEDSSKVKYCTNWYNYDAKVADWYQKLAYFGNFAGYKNDFTLTLRSQNDKKHLIRVSNSPGIFHVNENIKDEIGKYIAVYLLDSQEYIFFAPDGYYLASGNNAKHLSFGKNWESYPFEQFDLKYNRPDIILDRLGYADSSLIAAYHKAYLKRLKKMGFTEEMLKDDFHLPEIKIENFEAMPSLHDQGSIELDLKMKDSKYKLDRINVWVNDVAIYGTNGISLREKKTKELQMPLSVDLAKGNNKVQVSVLNQAGAESYKETFEMECTKGKTQPDLYLITIGESEFWQSDYNLTYAAKDAKDIAALFEKSKAYQEVNTKTLVNEEVTKENILGLKSFLKQADINDEVIIFIAGHGVLDANLNYYLATYDMDFQNPQEKGLAYEDLESLLDGIKPLKKTLMIDACHSGEIDKESVQLAENNEIIEGDIHFRAVGKKVESKLGMQNTFELSKSLFTDLRKGTGATVISSAGGMEFAMEGDDWNNGLFTYALLNGIESGEADLNGDKEIWLSELQKYVGQKVTELSNGKQQPTSRIENQMVDFRVW